MTVSQLRGQPRTALEWLVRCVALFGEFPDPLAGPALGDLARLTAELGTSALEACWSEVTGGSPPRAVRDYVSSHREVRG